MTYQIVGQTENASYQQKDLKGIRATASRNAQTHTQQQQIVNSTARPFPHPAAAWNLKTCPAKLSPTHKPI